jgi:phosphoenolpyruvate synthase/pyruvate phosphate dikinase
MTAASLILSLNTEQATLENAGGKGANLVRLVRAGFPVPDGFIVSTQAYRDFVNANALIEKIERTLAHVPTDDLDALESASFVIRQAFNAETLPQELAREIVEAYHRLGQGVVAVRSSATAEDLPGLSFAGQHESLLNVIGEEALMRAIVNCWASLWTARAISYRACHSIAHTHVALAVIVQTMVPSEAAGVMFTANPLTGARTEIVIEAVPGLGEALVSGQAEPDHYIVDGARKKIVTKMLSAQVLPEAQILELARLGTQVAEAFGAPQDIEWAWADGKFFLLQARPITTL